MTGVAALDAECGIGFKLDDGKAGGAGRAGERFVRAKVTEMDLS
jgi:hypothetical protein